MAIQQLIIRLFLMPLCRLTEGLSNKIKDRLFLAAGSGILFYAFLYHMQVIRWRYLHSFAICCVFLGFMILFSLPKEIKPVKFRPFFSLCWFGAGGLMLLSALRNNFNYLPEALLFLAAYPILYISWSNGDSAHRFRLLLKLCKISCVVFFVASFLFIKVTTQRYGGIFYNVNNCGSYLALAGICLILELLYEPNSIRRNICNILLFGMCYGMVTLTNSRSGKLALLCAVVIGTVFYLLTHKTKNKCKALFNIAGCVLTCTVMASCLLYAFQLRQYLPLPYYSQTTHSFYGVNSGIDPSVENTDPEFFSIESFDKFGDKKTSTEGKTADQYTSGRLSIWKGFLKRLTFFGVAQKEPLFLDGYDVQINTAHMTILEIAYESGIFAGILYLLVNVSSGILAIVYAWKNRSSKYAPMPLMVILAFGIVSLLGSFNSSFNYILTFYYYLVLFPLITNGRIRKENR